MKYNLGSPYFFNNDIKLILKEFKKILKGKGMLSMSKFVQVFEKNFSKYNKSKYVLATNSGSSALEIILKSLEIGKGDEVIIPTQTFIATASSVMNVGAKPIFAEIDECFLLNFNKIDKMINNRTKAVILVHYGGLISDQIMNIKKKLNKKNIYLIEDASHAHGASFNNIKAGNLSNAAAFSLYSTKIITSGEGGIITTNSKKIFNRCSSIRSRGQNINLNYEIFSNLGSNYRYTEVQALMAIMQLKRINNYINHRIKVANTYNKILETAVKSDKIRLINFSDNIIHPYWKYTIFLLRKQNRKKIKLKMNQLSIAISWAYDPLVHLQPVFKKYFKNKKGMLKYSEKLSKTHIDLPIHYQISIKDAEYIANSLLKFL